MSGDREQEASAPPHPQQHANTTINYRILPQRRDSITKHYSANAFPIDFAIAEDAYKQAVQFFKEELKSEKNGNAWLNGCSSIDDVLGAVKDSQVVYGSRSGRRWKWGSHLVGGWNRVSAGICYYKDVLDVMVQHHPEYVSLVWGALKFLFVVTINHEELFSKLAEAVIAIGEALPHAELLGKLYPTQRMNDVISRLYSHIIHFCIKATKWYKRGRFMKMMVAIKGPWTLEFGPTVAQVRNETQTIKGLGSLASRAELRDVHLDTHETKTFLQLALRNDSSRLTQNPLLFAQQTGEFPVLKIDRMLKHLFSRLPNPNETLRIGSIVRDRRRARGRDIPSAIWNETTLRQWATGTKFSILNITGSIVTRDEMKGLALDVIRIAQSAKLPVVWSMNTTMNAHVGTATATDIVKSLVRQIVDQLPDAVSANQGLVEVDFDQYSTVQDWVNVLDKVLSDIPASLIVLEASGKLAQGMVELAQCWRELVMNSTTIVKVLIVGYELTSPGLASL